MEDTKKNCARVIANGPVIITGPVEVTLADGTVEIKEKRASFCRCGASANKPYCDGKHKESDFVG